MSEVEGRQELAKRNTPPRSYLIKMVNETHVRLSVPQLVCSKSATIPT